MWKLVLILKLHLEYFACIIWYNTVYCIQVTALGVLCCFALFVCLTLLASFLPIYSSLIKTCTCMYSGVIDYTVLQNNYIQHLNVVAPLKLK